MATLAQFLSTSRDLLLVMAGFGLIVFLHELGHFVAARWAGIRVLAFALGFGPALFSYRKGMGFCSGSSEAAYIEKLKADREGLQPSDVHAISPTEYRFNLLPLGGYVKMLGQDDSNPMATSDAPDSYQNCLPWKRMVVISAGVIMNIITAAVLFIVVFMLGLKVEPAKVGGVQPGSPAATCVATNATSAGVVEPGLRAGDELLTVDGRPPNSFSDLVLAIAMAEKDHSIAIGVRRPGVTIPLLFNIKPLASQQTGLLEIGTEPSRSNTVPDAKTAEERTAFTDRMKEAGYTGIEPRSRLVRVADNDRSPDGNVLDEAIHRSHGKPVAAEFVNPDGKHVEVTFTPRPQLQTDFSPRAKGAMATVEHLLGLTPVMSVAKTEAEAKKQGLEDGDLFARIGNAEFPDAAQGMAEIKAHQGGTVSMVVLRKGADGVLKPITLPNVNVTRKGQVGFYIGEKSIQGLLVSLPPTLRHPGASENFVPAAASVIVSPGTRILAVSGIKVADFRELRAALLSATREANDRHEGATVQLSAQRPLNGTITDEAPVEKFDWKLAAADISAIHALEWDDPEVSVPFEPETTVRIAKGPVEAVQMGLAETRRVMLTTYITFARLAQGTVKVEHLKGPVGIAHLGTLVAGRGFIWLLFFMALISINLAVINFLPLPIVDGGQFLFLVYEQIRGKPVPPNVQNAVTMAGLVLIGSMFLIVTYNDITNLLGL